MNGAWLGEYLDLDRYIIRTQSNLSYTPQSDEMTELEPAD